MTTARTSGSIRVTPEGLQKVINRMAELEKDRDPYTKGWTQEDLADKSGSSLSTVKRFMNQKPIRRLHVIWITSALNLDPLEVVDPKEWNQDTGNLGIDWCEVCHTMLLEQQHIRRKASAMGFEVNVHVPLGLLERKYQQRRKQNKNVEREQVCQLDEEVITKTYEHDDFLEEVISQSPTGKNKHVAIVGEPGAGKTTLLSAIALHIKDNTQHLPIFISLGSLQGMTLEDYLLKKWLPHAMRLVNPQFILSPEIENQLITRFYQSGVWLLLDGVDEMGEYSPVQALNKISRELSTNCLEKARVILTCRLNVWDTEQNNNILIGFDTYKTQEFQPEEVDNFIEDWFTCAENIRRGEELKAKLKQPGKERIRELVTNPLRLSLLCQIVYQDEQGDLPKTKAELFERYIRNFYTWKRELLHQELINSDKVRQEFHQALGKLAKSGFEKDSRFRLQESLASDEMGETFFKFAKDVGWLNLVDINADNDESVYAFYHPNFQEYFAALAIDDWHYFLNHVPNNPEKGSYRIFEAEWQEVIILWMQRNALQENQNNFINCLMNFEDNCWGFYSKRASKLAQSFYEKVNDLNIDKPRFNLKLADSFTINDLELDIDIRLSNIRDSDEYASGSSNIIKELSNMLQNKNIWESKDIINSYIWESKYNIISTLSGIKSSEAFSKLIELLDNNNRDIRLFAATSLGELKPSDNKSIETLINLMENRDHEDYFPNECLFEDIVWAIKKLSNIEGYDYSQLVKNAINIINTHEDVYMRIEFLEMLQKIGVDNSEFVELLNHLIKPDQNPYLRAKSAYILGLIEPDNRTAITTLENLLIQDSIDNKYSWLDVVKNLLEIDSGNSTAIYNLIILNFISQVANSAFNRFLREFQKNNINELIKIDNLGMRFGLDNMLIRVGKLGEHFWFLWFITTQDNTQELIVKYIEVSYINENSFSDWSKIFRFSGIDIQFVQEIFKGNFNICSKQFPMWFEEHTQWEKTLEEWRKKWREREMAEWEKHTPKELQSPMASSMFELCLVPDDNEFITNHRPKGSIAYELCEGFLADCAQNMSYPEFYRAWHGEPSPLQNLETQFTDIHSILSELQPTDKTHPLVINLKSLQDETDTSAISQEICNQIYFTAFNEDLDIPEVNNAPQLKRIIPKIKKQLQTQNIALIVNNCEPNQIIITFCGKLRDVLHIAFITAQQLEIPLKGFPPNQPNLLNAIQTWINEIE
jgi:transcriptional regulator with XRE-family HTH domain/GTPase SAR1 family protein